MTEALAGAQVIVNLSASPYRARLRAPGASACSIQRAVDYLAAVVFVNTVGGQDELVFDGHSLAIDQDGAVLARGAAVRGGADALHDRPARGRGRAAARHAPPRERAPPAARRTRRRAAGVHASRALDRAAAASRAGVGGELRRHARPRGGGLRGAAHRAARLRREERLRARGARALGRDRLRARRR